MSGFQIETKRLLIRELELSDLDFVAEMLGDPEVMRFWPAPYSRAEAREWIARHRKRYVTDGFGYWLAVQKHDGHPVGQVGLLAQEFDGRKEVGLGYIVHRHFWRQGHAEESARACASYGFRELGLERIVILIRPENEPSVQLALKLGAKRASETSYSGFTHEVFELCPSEFLPID